MALHRINERMSPKEKYKRDREWKKKIYEQIGITVRKDSNIKPRLEALAKSENKSVNQFVIELIEKRLAESEK